MASTVLLVFLFAACLSAGSLVNENVHLQLAMNFTRSRAYQEQNTSHQILEVMDLISKLQTGKKIPHGTKQELQEAMQHLGNVYEEIINTVKQTTLGSQENDLTLEYLSPSTSNYDREPTISSKWNFDTVKQPLPPPLYVTEDPNFGLRPAGQDPEALLHHISTHDHHDDKRYTTNSFDQYIDRAKSTLLSPYNLKDLGLNSKPARYDPEHLMHQTIREDGFESKNPNISFKDYSDNFKSSRASPSEYYLKHDMNSTTSVHDREDITRKTSNYDHYPAIASSGYSNSVQLSTVSEPEYSSRHDEKNSEWNLTAQVDPDDIHKVVQYPINNSEEYTENIKTLTAFHTEDSQAIVNGNFQISGYESIGLAHQTSKDDFNVATIFPTSEKHIDKIEPSDESNNWSSKLVGEDPGDLTQHAFAEDATKTLPGYNSDHVSDITSSSTSSLNDFIIRNCYGATRLFPGLSGGNQVTEEEFGVAKLSTLMYGARGFPFNSNSRNVLGAASFSSPKDNYGPHITGETYDSQSQITLEIEPSTTHTSSQEVIQDVEKLETSLLYGAEFRKDATVEPTKSYNTENSSIAGQHYARVIPNSSYDVKNASQAKNQNDPADVYAIKSSLIPQDTDFASFNNTSRTKWLESGAHTRYEPELVHDVDFKDKDKVYLTDQKGHKCGGKSSNTCSEENSKVTDQNETLKINTDLSSEDDSAKFFEYNNSTRVKRGELAYVVSLQEKPSQHFCCGSAVTASWVLTAAHCFRPTSRRNESNLQVVLGTHRLPADVDDIQVVEVAYLIWHEHFLMHDKNNFKDDLALLKLKSEIVFGDVVSISPLSMEKDWSQQYDIVMGFSSLYPSELARVSLSSLQDEECKSNLNQNYQESFVCLQDPLLCLIEMDSGGPVIVDGVQTGVAVFPKLTGFLRISSYYSWIQNKTDYVSPRFAHVGKLADKGQFSFVVMVRSKDHKTRCTGSILSPEWVLVPGHCFRLVKEPRELEVLAGLTALDDAYGVTRNVTSFKWHQKLALLKLGERLRTTSVIEPCRLPEENEQIRPDKGFKAVGWQNLWEGVAITQRLYHVNVSMRVNEPDVLNADPKQPLLKGTMGSVLVHNGVLVAVSGEDQSQFTAINTILQWINSSIF